MNASNDNELAKALGGDGDVLAELELYCIKRNGYLLLAMPQDACAARATLGLYHPQARLARLLVWVVGVMIRFRCHLFLPKIQLEVRKRSPLAPMLEESNSMGFLLGNPESASRRAIIVYRANGQLLVDKLGFSGGARASVVSELEHIKGLPSENTALPEVVNEQINEQWASYATRYLDGKSPRKADEGKVLDVLKNWLKNSKPVILNETRQWQEMTNYAADYNVADLWRKLESASSKQVQVGVFHGDFAPWNVKVSYDGSVHVMDWESGCANGPAGWDWLHYMIQSSTLVSRHSAPKVLNDCREWARSNTGKEFLAASGWGMDVECWLGSYLMYSSWIGGFEREQLLEEWMEA